MKRLLTAVLATLLLCFLAATAFAAPQLINFQGRLSDTNGAAITDPALPMTFKVFDASTGGTELWSEDQTVAVQDGIYTVLLGSTGQQALDGSVFSSDSTWLEITVNGETMTPRQQFTSSAYALSAGSVANIQPSEIVTQSDIGTAPGQVPQLDAGGKLEAAVIPAGVGGVKIAYLKDVKPSGTSGGTATAGSWLTRDLNTLEGETSFVSLNGNQFTLQPGTYDIYAQAPSFVTAGHKAQLFNVSTGSIEIIGSNAFSNNSSASTSTSIVAGSISIADATSFEIRHMVQVSRATNGFGTSNPFGVDEIYTIVKITKLD